VGAVLIALGNGVMWPPVVALLSTAAGEHQGAVQGLVGSVSASASILGLFFGGILFHHFGGWLFVLSSVLIFAVVVLTVWYPANDKVGDQSSEGRGQ
jgi:DHA1 family tetracycline resistance protein-like MFS transporter